MDALAIEDAIATLDKHGESLAAYAIDFGLLKSGETVLIEMNDGYSIGTYCGVGAGDYADFTIGRWDELLRLRGEE